MPRAATIDKPIAQAVDGRHRGILKPRQRISGRGLTPRAGSYDPSICSVFGGMSAAARRIAIQIAERVNSRPLDDVGTIPRESSQPARGSARVMSPRGSVTPFRPIIL